MDEKEVKQVKIPGKMVITSEDKRSEIDNPVILLVTKKEKEDKNK